MSKRRTPLVIDRNNPMSAVDLIGEFDPVLAGQIAVDIYDSLQRAATQRKASLEGVRSRRDKHARVDETLRRFVRTGRVKGWSRRRIALEWLRKQGQHIDASDVEGKKILNACAARIARLEIHA